MMYLSIAVSRFATTHTIFHFRLFNRVHGKVHPNKCNFLVTQWSAANSAAVFGSAKSLAHYEMSAFGGKADMAFCAAHVCF